MYCRKTTKNAKNISSSGFQGFEHQMSLYENVQNKRKRVGLEENDEKRGGGGKVGWPGEPLPPKIEDKHFEANSVRHGSRGGETGEFSPPPPFFWAPFFLFCFLSLKYWLVLRPHLYGEKLSRVEGSPAYPSYPGRANVSFISLQNLANRLYEKQKVGSARRVSRLAG